ncbi:MAG: DUF3455 domain-containing protein [Burkholderiaceae bacterium]|nr:DUF3455 domain-containing protein [Burkholderiaceae bacterium]
MMPRLLSALLLALPAMNAAAQQPPPVSDAIKVPLGHVLKFAARAEGFQIYQCSQDKADPKLYAWTLTGPQADLADAQGNKLGQHYAGPTWESKDGSKIVGQVKGNEPSPDKDSIAWLLLETKPAGGTGVMNGITHVQRLQTHGGKAPKDGCNDKTAGSNVNAPYTAIYYFFEAAK